MRTAITIIAVACACMLLLIGANLIVETSSIRQAISDLPDAVVNYIAHAFSHYTFWTIVVICGIVFAIIYTNNVPPGVKSR